MGTDTQPYLNGKRTYRGASHAPKPGAKNPSGYIKRELAKKQSESRSGKAEAFLRARDTHTAQQEQPTLPQQPIIPEPLIPVGNTGIMKDRTGRLYYGGSTQAPQAPTNSPPI